jgi:hypothetical protein
LKIWKFDLIHPFKDDDPVILFWNNRAGSNPVIHRSRGDFLWITHSVLNMMFICSQRYFWATRMIDSALLFDNAKGQV